MSLLETIIARGTTAAKPAAAAANEGYLYFDTDLDKLQRSNGSAWQDVERADPAGGGAPTYVGMSVRHSANQNITTSTDTALAFDTELFDSNAFHDTVTNNSRGTVPTGKGGKYLVTANVYWDTNTSGSRVIKFKVNGTDEHCRTVHTAHAFNQKAISWVLDLAAGDYVQVIVWQDSGGTRVVNTDAGTRSPGFTMTLLGV